MKASRLSVGGRVGSLLLIGLVAFLVSLGVTQLLVSSRRSPSHGEHASQLRVDAILSSLPLVHNPRLSALEGCRDVQMFEDHLGSWTRGMARANTMPLNADNVLGKVVIAKSDPAQSTRLACIIPSIGSDGRARKAHQSWGHKCHRALYVTNKAHIDGIDKELVLEVHPPKDDRNSWQRLRAALHHVSTTPALHDENDFFLYAGDDSYVIVENLRKMLSEPYIQYLHKVGAPLYLGHRMVQSGANAPFVSGTAVILNRMALDILVAVSDNVNCDPTSYSESEDILIAACLRHHNIFPLNTQDVFGEDRLHMFDAGGVAAIMRDPSIASWYPPYRRKAMPKGIDGGVSRYSFHFHGMQEGSFDSYAGKISRE